jgi:hypothetical protein
MNKMWKSGPIKCREFLDWETTGFSRSALLRGDDDDDDDDVLYLLSLNQTILWPYKLQFWHQEKCECVWTDKTRTQQFKNAGQCGLIAVSVMALVVIDVTKSCLALALLIITTIQWTAATTSHRQDISNYRSRRGSRYKYGNL